MAHISTEIYCHHSVHSEVLLSIVVVLAHHFVSEVWDEFCREFACEVDWKPLKSFLVVAVHIEAFEEENGEVEKVVLVGIFVYLS